MGRIEFENHESINVEMHGMVFIYDGELSENLFYDKQNVLVYPYDGSQSFGYVNPVIQIIKRESGKTYFKLFSDPKKFDDARGSDNYSTILSVAKIAAMSFTDEQALAVKDIYDPFEVGRTYKKDEFFTYNDELFKVVKDHTSEAQWVPGEIGTESLYTKITLNDAGYPIWKQPTGAHDAYNIGDIVEYNGQLYKSKIDGNTYAPDAYPDGWEVYTEES